MFGPELIRTNSLINEIINLWPACTTFVFPTVLCPPRKSSFLSDDRLKYRIYRVRWYLSITMPSWLASDSKNGFHETWLGRNHSVPFRALLQRLFFQFLLPFPSAAYLLKLFLLPQRVHTTLFIRCDKPEHTRWCMCSLHAGIQMSPDEVVGSRDSCRYSIAKSIADVPIRLFRQIFSPQTALLSCPFP